MDGSSKLSQKDDKVSPIDLVHLDEHTFGSKDLQTEVLSLFSSHVARCLMELNQADTLVDWVRTAHGIKGSAKAVGATAVARLAQEAEQCDQHALEDTRQQHLDGLRLAIDEASHFIDLYLEKSALLNPKTGV